MKLLMEIPKLIIVQYQVRGLSLDPVSKSILQARLLVKTNAGFVAVCLVENNIIIIIIILTILNLVTRDTVFCSVVGGKQHHHHDRDGDRSAKPGSWVPHFANNPNNPFGPNNLALL